MKGICGTNMPVTLTLSLGGLCKKYGRMVPPIHFKAHEGQKGD